MDSNDHRRLTTLSDAISRRKALRGAGAAGIATAAAVAMRGPVMAAQATPTAATPQIEPEAGAWQTWLLTSGDQLRPDAPPDEAATATELAELRGAGGRPRRRRPSTASPTGMPAPPATAGTRSPCSTPASRPGTRLKPTG